MRDIELTPLAAEAPYPLSTPYVQASALDGEVKKVFEALIVEIRRQCVLKTDPPVGGGGGGPFASKADLAALKSTVITDLNSLRDKIMLTNASLDADTGVASTTYAANGNPPPITTV